MNRNEELRLLCELAVDNSLPIYDAIIRCACGDNASGVSGLSFYLARMCAAGEALDAGWHFDKESGKALCKKCWEAKETQ